MNTERFSGILLHITSLPSNFGIGDLGPEAYRFADFLHATGQSYWQILPLSPTETGSGNSPYSGLSAFAGNVLLISPEKLAAEGLISKEDLLEYKSDSLAVNFEKAIEYKKHVFEKAYATFVAKNSPEVYSDFKLFCERNALWLDDYALFVALRDKFSGDPWTEWPTNLRQRDAEALETARQELQDPILKQKFLQFIFFSQWYELKNYCKEREIDFFGDMPFYVGFDSCDVWVYARFFKLDEIGYPVVVSGVPPDFFSKTGQLWGTPVYNWDKLREEQFSWWVDRIQHNLKLFSLVRLDHFRAFSAYWEVPATEETAINGKWMESPGKEIFNLLKQKFTDLPILAEDLGSIDQPVRDLISEFNLPGMRVLLFGLGDDMPDSMYITHNHVENCVVYTGTHDNNTAKGWFENEATEEDMKRLSLYAGNDVTSKNVHLHLNRMAMMSVAKIAIIPMQDILGLGQEALMNRPSVAAGNWSWQLQGDYFTEKTIEYLKDNTRIFGRLKKRPE